MKKELKKVFKKRTIFVIDDLTTICANITSQLMNSENVGIVFIAIKNVAFLCRAKKRFVNVNVIMSLCLMYLKL